MASKPIAVSLDACEGKNTSNIFHWDERRRESESLLVHAGILEGCRSGIYYSMSLHREAAIHVSRCWCRDKTSLHRANCRPRYCYYLG
jgi:hypothetical protein